VHNNDFFYGAPGGDADQVKGDGSIDMKYNTTNM
jgi:pectate lyase